MKTHAAKNFKKEPIIHIRKHACEKKRKRLSDRSHTHWSLRLIPSSTYVKPPLHNTMCWKNQKQWVKPFWIEIPAPLRVHWMISSDWLNISESQGKPELLSRLTQTTTGSEFFFFFLTIKASLGPEALSSSCVSCMFSLSLVLSVSLLYLHFLSIALSANTGAQHLDTFSFHTILLGLNLAL